MSTQEPLQNRAYTQGDMLHTFAELVAVNGQHPRPTSTGLVIEACYAVLDHREPVTNGQVAAYLDQTPNIMRSALPSMEAVGLVVRVDQVATAGRPASLYERTPLLPAFAGLHNRLLTWLAAPLVSELTGRDIDATTLRCEALAVFARARLLGDIRPDISSIATRVNSHREVVRYRALGTLVAAYPGLHSVLIKARNETVGVEPGSNEND